MIMSITYKVLKEAVNALNSLEIEDLQVLRVIGVKKAILEQQFIEEVERIAGEHEEELPDIVINTFNFLLEGEDPEEAEDDPEEADPKEDEKPTKKTAPRGKKPGPVAKEKKERKAPPQAPRSRYNHIQDAISGRLDDALFEGGTIAQIMKDLDIKRVRIMSHIKHLKDDRGLTVKETPGDSLNLTKYKVKEESWKQE